MAKFGGVAIIRRVTLGAYNTTTGTPINGYELNEYGQPALLLKPLPTLPCVVYWRM